MVSPSGSDGFARPAVTQGLLTTVDLSRDCFEFEAEARGFQYVSSQSRNLVSWSVARFSVIASYSQC